jgi:ankyrin repeat protein
MLTRARSLFTRLFSFDTPTSQIHLAKTSDNNDANSNDHNNLDNTIDYDISNSANNNDDDDKCLQSSSTKGQYKRQISRYTHSHEKSKQNRLINAMQIATSRGNIESMKRLLNNMNMDINHRDQYGMSYLEHAILMGSFDMVDLLIRYGCDLHQGYLKTNFYININIFFIIYQVIRLVIHIYM